MEDDTPDIPKLMKIAEDNVRVKTQSALYKKEIIQEFAATINRHSVENDSNTPDFIIAEHLFECLQSFNLSVTKRCIWYNPTDSGRLKY